MSGTVERMLSYLPNLGCRAALPTDIKGILNACKAPVVSDSAAGCPIPMMPERKIDLFLNIRHDLTAT